MCCSGRYALSSQRELSTWCSHSNPLAVEGARVRASVRRLGTIATRFTVPIGGARATSARMSRYTVSDELINLGMLDTLIVDTTHMTRLHCTRRASHPPPNQAQELLPKTMAKSICDSVECAHSLVVAKCVPGRNPRRGWWSQLAQASCMHVRGLLLRCLITSLTQHHEWLACT